MTQQCCALVPAFETNSGIQTRKLCSGDRYRDFYVCESHFKEFTEAAILRTIAWG